MCNPTQFIRNELLMENAVEIWNAFSKHNNRNLLLFFASVFPAVLGDLRRRNSAEAGGLQSQRQHRRRMRGRKT